MMAHILKRIFNNSPLYSFNTSVLSQIQCCCTQYIIKDVKNIRRYATSSKQPVEMTYSKFDSVTKPGLPPLIIMHGLLGSRLNWKTLAKAINQKTGITVYTVDARNHGDSPHTDELNYECLSDDLVHFQQLHNLSGATLMGHSMGGKAVMAAALDKPDLVKRIIVLDISPVMGISEAVSSFPRFIDIMLNTKIPDKYSLSEGRKYLDKLLQKDVPELGIRQFLLARLIKVGNEFKWSSNIDSISKNFMPYIAVFPEQLLNKSYNGETTFIGGENSNYIKKSEHEEIKKLFPLAKFLYLPKAGHWLHADNPQGFLEMIIPLLI